MKKLCGKGGILPLSGMQAEEPTVPQGYTRFLPTRRDADSTTINMFVIT